MNLYGNIDGYKYTAPSINLLEIAKNEKQEPISIQETSVVNVKPAVSVDISEEGLKALHGSKLNGSADPFETAARIAYMSEHQPIESFTNQFAQMMPKNYELSESGQAVFTPHSMKEKEEALTKGFEKLYDEISKGYEDGTRVRYIEDASTEDGYRKLTKEEELSILKMEFDDFVDSRFGDEKRAYEATVKQAIKDVREMMLKLGKQPKGPDVDSVEEIPEGFADKLKAKTSDYAEEHGMKVSFMRDFIVNLKNSFSPLDMAFHKLG